MSGSTPAVRMLNLQDYTIAWTCRIRIEFVAAQAFLDETHDLGASRNGTHYALGRIGRHNVAIFSMIDGRSYGLDLMSLHDSYPNIQLLLSVGIGSGPPSGIHDIPVRWGDVVVDAGVVHWFCGEFLSQPLETAEPLYLRSAVRKLRACHVNNGQRLEESIDSILEQQHGLKRYYQRPSAATDKLSRSALDHGSILELMCTDDLSNLMLRPERAPGPGQLAVHYGKIEGAEWAMRSALDWDELESTNGILCFDEIAAKLPIPCPTITIRGISDYVDAPGDGKWRGYAAMAAAAFAKSLLREIPSVQAGAAAAATSAFEPENAASSSRANLSSRVPLARPRQSARPFTPETTSSPRGTSPAGAPPTAADIALLRPCYIMCLVMLLVITGSASFAIYWTLHFGKMGDGFTAASWMVAVGTLALAPAVARHYPYCTCWSGETLYTRGLCRINTMPAL